MRRALYDEINEQDRAGQGGEQRINDINCGIGIFYTCIFKALWLYNPMNPVLSPLVTIPVTVISTWVGDCITDTIHGTSQLQIVKRERNSGIEALYVTISCFALNAIWNGQPECMNPACYLPCVALRKKIINTTVDYDRGR